jgi:acyl carrier protein
MEASGAVPPVKGGLNSEVRAILAAHGGISADISTLDDQANLFRAGLSSHASVNVMLALEDAFDVEFPDHMLTRSVFESVEAIVEAISGLAEPCAAV